VVLGLHLNYLLLAEFFLVFPNLLLHLLDFFLHFFSLLLDFLLILGHFLDTHGSTRVKHHFEVRVHLGGVAAEAVQPCSRRLSDVVSLLVLNFLLLLLLLLLLILLPLLSSLGDLAMALFLCDRGIQEVLLLLFGGLARSSAFVFTDHEPALLLLMVKISLNELLVLLEFVEEVEGDEHIFGLFSHASGRVRLLLRDVFDQVVLNFLELLLLSQIRWLRRGSGASGFL